MTDPIKDNNAKKNSEEANTAQSQTTQPENKDKGNWDDHQQVDEEGNELSPDDIK